MFFTLQVLTLNSFLNSFFGQNCQTTRFFKVSFISVKIFISWWEQRSKLCCLSTSGLLERPSGTLQSMFVRRKKSSHGNFRLQNIFLFFRLFLAFMTFCFNFRNLDASACEFYIILSSSILSVIVQFLGCLELSSIGF